LQTRDGNYLFGIDLYDYPPCI